MLFDPTLSAPGILQNRPSVEVFFVIDGLEEVPFGPDRDEVVGSLQSLRLLGLSHLHLLTTSRPETDLKMAFQESPSWPSCPIAKDEVNADIRIYVHNEIERHPRLRQISQPTKNSISERLSGKENGM
jgi:hypothetical protein